MGSRADLLCENDRVRKIREQTTKKSPKAKLTVPSDVLLITFNLSLKQRMMEFALKCEAEPPGHANNRRQLHLFTEQKKKTCVCFHLCSRQRVTGVRTPRAVGLNRVIKRNLQQ